jgi:hypothetical protein
MFPNWNLWIAAIRRFKWPLVLLFYAAFIKVATVLAICTLGLFMGLGVAAIEADRRREARRFDSFSGDSLFFRYGRELFQTRFTFSASSGLEPSEVRDLAVSLQERLSARVRASLFGQPAALDEALVVQNSRTGQEKAFIKIVALTDAETRISYFIHYQAFGMSLTAHYSAWTRGKTDEFALVKFVVMCPFSIWLWGVPWLLDRYSLMAALSGAYGDSFDEMDMATIFRAIHYDVIGQTQELLEEEGLMSEDLRGFLVNLTQNVTASGSSTINIGSMNQPAPVPRAKA